MLPEPSCGPVAPQLGVLPQPLRVPLHEGVGMLGREQFADEHADLLDPERDDLPGRPAEAATLVSRRLGC